MEKTQLLLLMTPVILFSLTIHECAHGQVAFWLGDDTAKRLGRLSLNPLRHLDPLGVIFFYLMGFGWAKPVPVDWRNFENPRRDMMYVSFAGPFSNMILATAGGAWLRFIDPLENPLLFPLLSFVVYINAALAVFNMIPVFPLDGASILKGLVSREAAFRLAALDRFGGLALFAAFLADHFLHTGILWFVTGLPIVFIVKFLTQEKFPLLEQVLLAGFN